jgi:ATP-binding cassette subfamily E protein 1
VTNESKIAFISERLCIGCGICPKKCPFDAINIINLPTNLETQVTHRYSANSFKLHRLPMPRPGQVLGLVGTNGIGKSTALKILSGKLKPNLGRFDNPPDWEEILKYFRGSELQSKRADALCCGHWLTAYRLLHQDTRRQPQGCRQAAICRPNPQGHQGD